MKTFNAEEIRGDDRADEVEAREDVLELSLDEMSYVAGGMGFLKLDFLK